jgi:hypothetical protein
MPCDLIALSLFLSPFIAVTKEMDHCWQTNSWYKFSIDVSHSAHGMAVSYTMPEFTCKINNMISVFRSLSASTTYFSGCVYADVIHTLKGKETHDSLKFLEAS